MSKMKESMLDEDGIPQLVEETYHQIKYEQLFNRILLSLLANPAINSDEAPTADQYIESAKHLTKAALSHLSTK